MIYVKILTLCSTRGKRSQLTVGFPQWDSRGPGLNPRLVHCFFSHPGHGTKCNRKNASNQTGFESVWSFVFFLPSNYTKKYIHKYTYNFHGNSISTLKISLNLAIKGTTVLLYSYFNTNIFVTYHKINEVCSVQKAGNFSCVLNMY